MIQAVPVEVSHRLAADGLTVRNEPAAPRSLSCQCDSDSDFKFKWMGWSRVGSAGWAGSVTDTPRPGPPGPESPNRVGHHHDDLFISVHFKFPLFEIENEENLEFNARSMQEQRDDCQCHSQTSESAIGLRFLLPPGPRFN